MGKTPPFNLHFPVLVSPSHSGSLLQLNSGLPPSLKPSIYFKAWLLLAPLCVGERFDHLFAADLCLYSKFRERGGER